MKRVSMLAALAAVSTAPSLAQSPTSQSVIVAANPTDPGAELYYGIDRGSFARAGLDVHPENISNNGTVVAGVIGGSINIGYSNILTLIAGFRKGLPITLVAPAGLNDDRKPTNYLIVSGKSSIRSAKDLEGKVIAAVPLKSLSDLPIIAWMDANGADSTKAKFVEIPFPEMPAAFQQGRIDAAFMTETFAVQVRSYTRVLTHPYVMIAKRFLGSAYFARPQWATDHREVVDRFASVVVETAQWANQNPSLSAPILAKYSKVPLSTIAAMTRQTYAERLLVAEIQPIIDFAAKYKLIDAAFPAQDMIFKAG